MENRFDQKLIEKTSGREKFFQEYLAIVLQNEPGLCKQFLKVLLQRSKKKDDDIEFLKTSKITEIKTEKSVLCRKWKSIDMYFILKKGTKSLRIGVENKLKAGLSKDQLQNYIKSKEIDRLAFITETTKGDVRIDILKNIKYLGNKEHDRFFWSEFYNIIKEYAEKKPNEFTRFLLQLFEQKCLKPYSLPEDYKLANKDEEIAFQKMWGPTRTWLNEMYNWHTEAASRCGVYASKGNSKTLYAIWLEPHLLPGRLRVRLTFKEEKLIPEAKKRLDKLKENYSDINISIDKGEKDRHTVEVIDVVYPLASLLDKKSEGERKEALKMFVQDIICRLD